MDVMDIKASWNGTKEWKVAQDVFHRLNRDHEDDLKKFDITFSDDIVNNALLHFKEKIDLWIYPAKSYFVAICYAYWLSEDFQEDFWDLLSDPNLLAGNDPYYQTYGSDPETYNSIISQLVFPLEDTGMVSDVRKYYEQEFNMALKRL